MLTEDIARQIVKETMGRLNRNINIMDDKGVIIASGDQSRIDHVHAAARQVLETKEAVIVAEAGQMKGTLPGINLPIIFDGKIAGVIGITGNPEEIRDIGELVKMSTELMLRQAVVQERTEWEQRMREVAFDELVSGEFEWEALKKRLEMTGAEAEAPFQIAIAEVDPGAASKAEVLEALRSCFGDRQAMCGYLSVQRIFILSMGMTEERFRRQLQQLLEKEAFIMRIGQGTVAGEAEQVRYAYEEALCALKLGRGKYVVSYAEIEIQALLNRLSERARSQFSGRVLDGLSPMLVHTVEIFLQEGLNIGKCAERMFIHRNSLNYRLKKVCELTGYDPRVFHDALTLQLAIWGRQQA